MRKAVSTDGRRLEWMNTDFKKKSLATKALRHKESRCEIGTQEKIKEFLTTNFTNGHKEKG